jgi:hypothetical protein
MLSVEGCFRLFIYQDALFHFCGLFAARGKDNFVRISRQIDPQQLVSIPDESLPVSWVKDAISDHGQW